MIKYELIEAFGTAPSCIKATDENDVVYFIPIDAANSDYQAYLKSLEAEQSTPIVTKE
jgi:hypothetical protein